MPSITVVGLQSGLAADLLQKIGAADFIEGLADDVRELAAEYEDQSSAELEEVVKLYEWLEAARAEYLDLRAEINEILERQEQEADSAP